jgi:hypothetical protein
VHLERHGNTANAMYRNNIQNTPDGVVNDATIMIPKGTLIKDDDDKSVLVVDRHVHIIGPTDAYQLHEKYSLDTEVCTSPSNNRLNNASL